MNFGEVWRAQLAKSILLTSKLVPLGSFKIWSDAKERVRKATGSSGKTADLVPEFTVKNLPSAELQPMFLRLQWRTCPWVEHYVDDYYITGCTGCETWFLIFREEQKLRVFENIVFTVYEEQLKTNFSRETENVFTLSLYYDVDGIGATPPPFLWTRQWWLVPLWSDH